LKAFDTIFAITQGGPGTASETINIYLYLQAFAFFKIGEASAVVVVFFVLIVACSLGMLALRQRARWA
jgi:multiple sugar transport system permease protein